MAGVSSDTYNRCNCIEFALGWPMLDREGYRPNVGIILVNQKNEVFWGKRIREHAWQFPQGGIKYGESPVQAMYRELHEAVGLPPEHVQIGRAPLGKECVGTCRSRWSPNH